MTQRSGGPRQRYREQVRAEIKALAWAQIAEAGASALSLNAIAKRMGVSGPAIYRYFAGRDELLTELILDAYRDLAAVCAAASTTPAGGGSWAGRLVAVAEAIRAWALAAPQRYLLIYGTPVPGYHAPPEATRLAEGIMTTLLDTILADPPTSRPDPEPVTTEPAPGSAALGPSGRELETELALHRTFATGHPAPPAVLRTALALWTRVHGVISLELAGHFAGMGFDPALLFAAELETLTSYPV